MEAVEEEAEVEQLPLKTITDDREEEGESASILKTMQASYYSEANGVQRINL